MTGDGALQLLATTLWGGVLIGGPLLAVTLVVGVAVGVLQVVTQIQDVSLSFIPKIAAVVIGLAVIGPWMLREVVGFAIGLISQIPGRV
jgi:flagellar biosynthetic protein FliQ